MSKFKSWRSYWEFERAVRQHTRYVYDIKVTEFLETVLATSVNRSKAIREGSFLWRAQLGRCTKPYYQNGEHIGDEPTCYPAKRMKPKPESAKEGRANPKGIPCLYLASGQDPTEAQSTAIAEVRPWVGALISVAQFKVARNLKMIDCRSDKPGGIIYIDEPSSPECEKAVWRHIDKAYAKPVDPNDTHVDYVPTQIIADLFRSKGLDGVVYRSTLGPGYNVTLFDLDSADPINCFLFEVTAIEYETKEAASPYYFRKYSIEENPTD